MIRAARQFDHRPSSIYHGKQAWVTEYGTWGGWYRPGEYLNDNIRLSGLRALDVLGRVFTGIRYSSTFTSLQYFNLGGQGTGLNALINLTDPSVAQVSPLGQVWAHVASVAMSSSTMHVGLVTASGAETLPVLPFQVLGLPNASCVLAAAFSGAEKRSLVILNRCTRALSAALDVSVNEGLVDVNSYIMTEGNFGWAQLPAPDSSFPWPGPLTAEVSKLEAKGAVATATLPPLSVMIVSSRIEKLADAWV